MSAAQPETGRRSRKVWVVVATLTTIGLVGPLVLFLVGTAASPPDPHACQGNAGVVVYFLTLIGLALFALAAVAALGLWIFWYRSFWGPLLLVVCNLLMMGFYGWSTVVSPGQLLFGVLVVAIAAAPAIAAALVLWALLTRGRLWVRAAEFVIIAAIGLPLLWLYASGLSSDIRTALTPPVQAQSTALPGPPQGCA